MIFVFFNFFSSSRKWIFQWYNNYYNLTFWFNREKLLSGDL